MHIAHATKCVPERIYALFIYINQRFDNSIEKSTKQKVGFILFILYTPDLSNL